MSATRSKAFELTSSHHKTNDVMHFNDKDNINYYLRGAKTLFSEREDKFDYTPDNINNFLQAIDEISQEYGWDYDCKGISWGNRGVIIIVEAP